eukprot:scaffold45737_cov281-Isochrysis_galbana.AAC.1
MSRAGFPVNRERRPKGGDMLLAARHRNERSMLLVSLLAMCKTAGAIQCDGQTLDAANIASVQACT